MNHIYADFMKCDYSNRLQLTCLGTFKDLERFGMEFVDGQRFVFYNDDQDEYGNPDNLVVAGIVEYDKTHERWVASIDWDDIKNISKLSPEEKRDLGIDVD